MPERDKPLRNTLLIKARRRASSPSGAPRAMSRQELADAINAYLWRMHQRRFDLDENDIGRLERGETRWPGALRRQAFRAVLNVATDAELGFYAMRQRREPNEDELEISQRAADVSTPSVSVQSRQTNTDDHPSHNRGYLWPADVFDRHDAESGVPTLRLPSSTTALPSLSARDGLVRAVAEETRLAAGFTRSVAASSVDPVALDQIAADIQHLARSFVSTPLVELFCEIRDLRRDVTALIERNRYPSQLRDLHLAESRLSGLCAHVCLDLGDYESSATHARAAWLSADLAGYPEMQAWVRALQSLIAYWDGRLNEALAAAQDGMRYASHNTVMVRLLSLQARTHARRHEQSDALAALAAAEEARAKLVQADEIGGLFTFPEAKQAAYAGTTLLALDQPALLRRAAAESTRALALYQAGAPLDRSIGDVLAARLDLAVAHIADDSLDGAEVELAHVLRTPPDQRTASVISRGLAIATQLTGPRYTASPQAARIRAGLVAFATEP